MPSTQLSSPRNELTGNERSLYPCLFRAWQACIHLRCKSKYNLWIQHKIFQLRFFTEQSVSFLFILNSHAQGIGPIILVPDWLRRSRVKVFVSLCSYSTGGCVRSSKQIGAETFVKNNGKVKVQVFDTPQVSTVLRSNLMRFYLPVDLTGNLIMIEK